MLLLLLIIGILGQFSLLEGKIYERCELANQLQHRFGLPLNQVAVLVCIAQHTSDFNTAYFGGGDSHGLFQISDVFWCDKAGGAAGGCGLSCSRLRDNDIADDVLCVRKIYAEHQRIAGDGFTAWQAYGAYCRQDAPQYLKGCAGAIGAVAPLKTAQSVVYYQNRIPSPPPVVVPSRIIPSYPVRTQPQVKIYQRCELAQELYYKHKMPMQQIPTWVCIAQHESSFNTGAVGRLNADGSADHGLFQISDLFWCSHDPREGGKGCQASCAQFLDSSITDDVQCIKRIHREHTQISGDGFNAWTVYQRNCRNQGYEQVASCFKKPGQAQQPTYQHPNAIGFSHEIVKQRIIAPTVNPYYRPAPPLLTYQPQPQPQPQLQVQPYLKKDLIPYQGNPFLRPRYTAQPQTNALVPATTKKGYSQYTHPFSQAGKVYKRCELAQELYFSHKFPMQDIATWVCIAEHESSFNTAAVGRLNADGSADHGLFQISDLYWCSHDGLKAKGCHLECNQLLDGDITDDVECIKTIYEEHTRLSGDGFTAWTVYPLHCKNRKAEEMASCFDSTLTAPTKQIVKTPNPKAEPKGKIYQRCELAQDLYYKHKMPMQQIPTWVCIAEHESSFNTAAVGRLNSDGSLDHGLFQISDLYWCSHDHGGGKACNIQCDRLLDADIADDVQCIKTIYEEHTRLSGDGFTAWTVYPLHCKNRRADEVANCFDSTLNSPATEVSRAPKPKPKPKGKIYERCELAQDLYYKHKMPMQQIPTWVCIAEHESSFNTAAIGRLNSDGSLDHGLFQISDLFWCSHGSGGGKACNIECDRLLDADIADDVKCIKTIYEEHTRLSGDGFNAWTVYPGHCKHQSLAKLSDCFQGNEIGEANHQLETLPQEEKHYENVVKTSSSHSYSSNPFLQNLQSAGKPPQKTKPPLTTSATHMKPQLNAYDSNPFLQRLKPQEIHKWQSKPMSIVAAAPLSSTNNYAHNPFLRVPEPSNHVNSVNHLAEPKPSDNNFNYVGNPVVTILSKPLVPTASKPAAVALTTKSPPHHYLQQPTRPYISSDSFRNEVIKFTATSVSPTKTSTTTTKKTSTTAKFPTFPVWSWQNYVQSTTAVPSTARPTTTRYSASSTTTTRRTTKPIITRSTMVGPITPRPTTEKSTTAGLTHPKPTTTRYFATSPTSARPTTANPLTTRQTTLRPTTPRPTTTTKPITTRPTTARSTTARPTTARPTTTRPTSKSTTTKLTKPTTTRYFATHPTTTKPSTARPITTRPTTARSTTARSTTARAITTKPTTIRPTTTRPTTTTAATTRPTPARYNTGSPTAAKKITTRATISPSFFKTTARPTAQAPSTSTRTPIQRSTTPKPYLFTSTTARINTSDPFSHPFFQKFKQRFEKPSKTTTVATSSIRVPTTTTTSSPYYAKYQENKLKVAAKTVYSYDFGQNRTITSTTRKPSSAFDLYLKWNKN